MLADYKILTLVLQLNKTVGNTVTAADSKVEYDDADDVVSVTESDLDAAEVGDATSDAAGHVPSEALDVTDRNWRVGHPMSQPLKYYVPSDASGGKILKQLPCTIDFNDKTSVRKAVKARQASLTKAKKKHGLPLAKPSTKGRGYPAAAEAFIIAEHVAWAESQNNYQIPLDHLVANYNRHFPGENRTASGISAYLSRTENLRTMRASYTHNG